MYLAFSIDENEFASTRQAFPHVALTLSDVGGLDIVL